MQLQSTSATTRTFLDFFLNSSHINISPVCRMHFRCVRGDKQPPIQASSQTQTPTFGKLARHSRQAYPTTYCAPDTAPLCLEKQPSCERRCEVTIRPKETNTGHERRPTPSTLKPTSYASVTAMFPKIAVQGICQIKFSEKETCIS